MAARSALLCCLALFSGSLLAADTASGGAASRGSLVDFSVESRQSAANDQGRATAFIEADGASPGELSQKVNTAMTQALAMAKQSLAVHSRSGNSWTSPIYGKNGRNIEGWRMRSELLLESRDIPALAALLGKLQGTMGISQISLQPAADTRDKAETLATTEAITAFRNKAKLIAAQLGRDYRIVQLNIGNQRGAMYVPMQTMALRAEAAPMPLEGGESQITVTVSGQIEVLP